MAANLSQLGIGQSIKSIQRGVSMSGAVAISAVNMAKAELRNLGNSSSAGSVVLTNSTTVTVATGAGSVSWEITESF